MESKKCLVCGTEFFKKKTSKKRFAERSYCSRACFQKQHVSTVKISRSCVVCQKVFLTWPYRKDAKLCSMDCTRLYRKTPAFSATVSVASVGKVLSEETKRKISEVQKGKRIGELSANWKGQNVKYRALHDWVRRVRGTPDTCEHCGAKQEKGRRLAWANRSHRYLRDVNDWMRLCYPCHRKYDFPHENRS